MPKTSLVIVESPAKARTIEKYLGPDFQVLASVGHIVDLPRSGLGVDVEHGFELDYVVTKPEVVRTLREALKGAATLYLATDEDREGEAIAWHLKEQLKPKVPVHRMVFHEITKKAIAEAVAKPRDLDMGLVDAQEARRALDRLYGYEVSPLLWRKVAPRLSAGRVQSPALRLIVQRELERMRFHSASYWNLVAKHPTSPAFDSTLNTVDGRRIATGKDFDENGKVTSDARLLDEAAARALSDGLRDATFTVRKLERRPYRSSPKPPFITSTLQQEGGRKLRLSAKQVMRVAQGLYERGYITYMRTDSTALSETALSAARAQIAELFGKQFLPAGPRTYEKKAKNAQEAHEAIRPAGDAFRTPEELSGELKGLDLQLYELIWKRTLASQMADAEGESVSVELEAASDTAAASRARCTFSASGRTISFPGFLRAYVEGTDDPDAALDDRESPLPPLEVGQSLTASAVVPSGHATSPPARYTEASLVKKLEELGIGRPSTYASIMGALQDRYVWKKGQALVPEWVSFVVVRLMEENLTELIEYAFTAEMEDDLDEISNGERKKVDFLRAFYVGETKRPGLRKLLEKGLTDIDPAALNRGIAVGADPGGNDIVVKIGRYGPYIRRGEDTAPVPDKVAPDELTAELALKQLEMPKGGRDLGVDPETGLHVFAKTGRFGPYVQLGEAKDKEKPQKTTSIPPPLTPESVTFEQAQQLLALPRALGAAPDGGEVALHYGRYGWYVKKGDETRNLVPGPDLDPMALSLEKAVEILAQPKQFRGRGQPKPPLATFGEDPASGKPIIMKEGRFGPYVTDGETSASLRRGDDPSEITPERAVELLAERREYLASPEGQERAAARAGKKAARGGRAARGAARQPAAAAAGEPKKRARAGGRKGAAAKAAPPEAAAVARKTPTARKAPAVRKPRARKEA
jgi:DNA topoisomerase I